MSKHRSATIPGWVKISIGIILALILLFIILHLTGHSFGDHMLHSSMMEHGGQTL